MLAKKAVSNEKLLARAQKDLRADAFPLHGPIWLVEECEDLAKALETQDSNHRVQRELEFLGHSVIVRSAYALITGAATGARDLRDGWKLRTLAAFFFERDALEAMPGCRSIEEVSAKKALTAGHYWRLAQVVWGQLGVGLRPEGEQGLDLLHLCEIRGQDKLPEFFAGLPRAVNHLLRAESPKPSVFGAFSQAPTLQSLSDSWGEDRSFRKALYDACDWHLRSLYPAGDTYYEGIVLFPAWLFAIDRYRRQHTGRSCLPDHPLIAHGRRILDADFGGPEHPLVSQAEEEYSRRYGDKPVNFEAEWREFLKSIEKA